jgi:hypothetical protein
MSNMHNVKKHHTATIMWLLRSLGVNFNFFKQMRQQPSAPPKMIPHNILDPMFVVPVQWKQT